MRKHILLLSILFCVTFSFAQNPEIKNTLPTIIPPSPTVAALMKFEEVPVSNYTGIPDVSIPLFSTSTLSKDINIDISLKYHAGVGANDRASDVGLGWSLLAGGTISRTVRGLPDELLLYPNFGSSPAASGAGKIGLYHNELANHPNKYYFFKDNIANETQDYYQPYLSQQVQDIGNEFLWNAAFTGKYDTEHDLWQFNFMGYSGRFYILRNASNQLEVKPLDDYRIKITNTYAPDPSNSVNLFIPTGFTVYDEKGYKYIFDIKETTINSGGVEELYFENGAWVNPGGVPYSEKSFISAFHLSKVYDNNNKLIIDFEYNDNQTIIKEAFTDNTETFTDYINLDGMMVNIDRVNCCQDFPAIKSSGFTLTVVTVKKLVNINVINKAKISFEFNAGRLDNTPLSRFLNSVTIKDWNGNQIKKYSFKYDYSTVIKKRMILSELNLLGSQNTFESNYNFSYVENDTNEKVVGTDYWGYFNLINPCELTTENHRNPSPEFSTTNLLQKIKYPTGGCSIFNYEANTYSYTGNVPIIDFSDNPSNKQLYLSELPRTFNNWTPQYIEPVNQTRYARFYPSIVLNDEGVSIDRRFQLSKLIDGLWVPINISLFCRTSNCCIDVILDAGIKYKIVRALFNIGITITDTLQIDYYVATSPIKQYLYGGGNRIKKIGYFKNDTPKNYYALTNNSSFSPPDKEKNYKYTSFLNPLKSSGSLTFPKPLYHYTTIFKTVTSFGAYNSSCSAPPTSMMHYYESYTSYNNFSVVKTHGADVGYKEVTVYETNNGRTEYTYTSPIDYPEIDVPQGPPYIPTKNIDYKRGLPLKEVIYDNQDRVLIETVTSEYSFAEYLVHTGTRFRKPFGECYTGKLPSVTTNYNNYIAILNEPYECVICKPNFSTFKNHLCGLPLDINKPKIMLFPIFEAYGWAKLEAKTTLNYFYPNGGTTPNIVQTNETYDYNSLNKKISESTVSNSKNELLTTKYFYDTTDTITRNRISEIERIETYRGTNLLSTSKINYVNTFPGNTSYLPQTIQTAKEAQALENRVVYNKYDEFSNPLELQQEGGTKVCYIWGYNKSQPVAKIENIAYADIPTILITNIENITNSPTSTPVQIENVLDSLYDSTDVNMQKAMITTYSYIPLVGVKTITDPKRDKTTYEYDTFNKLKAVYDNLGNKLSENDYHYRPQN